MCHKVLWINCQRLSVSCVPNATNNNISVSDIWRQNEIAGKEWLCSFRIRHPDISLKKPEACLAGATSFNRITVTAFVENLKRAMDRNPSFDNGYRVYKLDEGNIT